MIDEKIKQVMATVFEIEVDSITDDASPDTIEIWDSLHHMNLVVALEEEFGVAFDDEQIGELLNFKLIKLAISELTKS
jgi:acyl carrier protein